jgi:hypothetical protein
MTKAIMLDSMKFINVLMLSSMPNINLGVWRENIIFC